MRKSKKSTVTADLEPLFIPLDESRTATVKQRPQVRTYGTAEIQVFFSAQKLRNKNMLSVSNLITSFRQKPLPRERSTRELTLVSAKI